MSNRQPLRSIQSLFRLGLVCLLGVLPPLVGLLGARLVTAQGLEPDECAGDERISFAPAVPIVGEPLLVAVTSSRPHRGVWLAGGDNFGPQREYAGQLGWVWNWLVTPQVAGPFRVQFFVDSTTFCTAATIEVGLPGQEAAAAEQPAPDPTPNGASDPARLAGESEPRGPNASGKPKGPQIASLSTTVICEEKVLMIRGQGFGEPRLEVDGKVVLGGTQVQHYLRWTPTEVIVLVPDGTRQGRDRPLYLINNSGYAVAALEVTAAPC